MEFTAFTAGTDDEGKRLDRIVKALLARSGAPSGNIFQAVRKRLIRVNGQKADASQRIGAGDRIEIAAFLIAGRGAKAAERRPPGAKEAQSAPPPPLLPVIFQNDDLLFINKPSGILVQPAAPASLPRPAGSGGGEGTSISQLVQAAWEQEGGGGSLSFTPAPLHRLDRYTSGILAVSKSARGARYFSQALKEHAIQKTYIGVCQGRMEDGGLWEDRLVPELPDGKAGEKPGGFHKVRAAVSAGSGGRPYGAVARTLARPLCRGGVGTTELTLVRFEILTGRKHQIRAQSALHGHPLYADTAYGGRPGQPAHFFLHAMRLEFPEGNPLALPRRLEAPLPEDFAAFVGEAFGVEKLEKVLAGKYNRR